MNSTPSDIPSPNYGFPLDILVTLGVMYGVYKLYSIAKERDECKKEHDECKKERDECKKEHDECKKERDECKKETQSLHYELIELRCQNKIQQMFATRTNTQLV